MKKDTQQILLAGGAVVGLIGVAVILYEVMGKSSSSPSLTSDAARPPATVTPVRSDQPQPGVFTSSQPPDGVSLTMTPGALSAGVPSGKSITLILPRGARWQAIIYGTTASAGQTTGSTAGMVSLGTDATSNVSLSSAQLGDSNLIQAVWTDASGNKQETFIKLQKIASLRLHA